MGEEIKEIIGQLKEILNRYPDKQLEILLYVFGRDNLMKIINKPSYEDLQQENQQLKEELNKYKRIYRENPTLYDEIAPYIINKCNLENIIKQYKSVLDEIREYSLDLHLYDNESLEFKISNDLLQILDKVKE